MCVHQGKKKYYTSVPVLIWQSACAFIPQAQTCVAENRKWLRAGHCHRQVSGLQKALCMFPSRFFLPMHKQTAAPWAVNLVNFISKIWHFFHKKKENQLFLSMWIPVARAKWKLCEPVLDYRIAFVFRLRLLHLLSGRYGASELCHLLIFANNVIIWYGNYA